MTRCPYCHGARLVGWSGAGPILCPECSRGQDAFTVITRAWRDMEARAISAEAKASAMQKALAVLADAGLRHGG